MAALGEDFGMRERGFELTCEAAPPSLGHLACGSHGREIAHAAQGIFSTTVNDSLGLNGLSGAQGCRFQKDGVVTSAPYAIEAPQSGSAATEYDDV
jgi:hypothetical protein